MSAAAVLSPNYLAHLLKKETGKTFTGWVTDRRLEFAQGLLMHSSQRVASIAHASGLADEACFVRRFHQRFGNTPKAYCNSFGARISGSPGCACQPVAGDGPIRPGPSRVPGRDRCVDLSLTCRQGRCH
ncbi:helix-turn-helix transcriptional regulator [Polaromonas sp. CG_9.11]|uniref:helix-turn-helix transcriptional regulator n=1 Tax=Polaromonas sp. CG_9.11 TaxID=2787730 RepID=UPI00351C5A6E